jgi:protein-L-isoaspartate(D-aspartate) O-methyltransferase
MDIRNSILRKQKIAALHQQLIDQMKNEGHITSKSVEAAFRAVPRHHFLPELAVEDIYQDQAIVTKKALDERVVSSSSQPTMMAIMLEQLQLQPGQRVLEIGAGTGYNAALMAHIVGKHGQVVTLDIDEDIVGSARSHLQAAGYEQVQVICADGFAGYAEAAPYDRIILTVNAADIAPAWREQLKPDGRLLLPLSLRGRQVSVVFEWVEDHLESVSMSFCRFVSLRGALTEEIHTIELQPTPDLLTLSLYSAPAVEAATVGAWLRQPYQEMDTSIQVTAQDLLSSLSLWVATREPGFCILMAQGSEANRSSIPMPLHSQGQVAMSATGGLLDEQSLCLLVKDSEQPPAKGSEEQQMFTLKIRSAGIDPQHSLAQRLKAEIESWEQAGRPDARRLHIKAFPEQVYYQKVEQELLVSQRWTRFVITW